MDITSILTVQTLLTALAVTTVGTFVMRWLSNQPLCNWLLTAGVIGAIFGLIENHQILSFYL